MKPHLIQLHHADPAAIRAAARHWRLFQGAGRPPDPAADQPGQCAALRAGPAYPVQQRAGLFRLSHSQARGRPAAPAGGAATDTAVDPDVDPIRMRDIGSVGLKFLVLWRNDESPDSRAKLVEEFNKLCTISGLPSIIEIIVKPPTDTSRTFNREEELIIAAREAASWKPDLYKAEVPFHGEGDLNLVTKNAERISEAIGSPWVVLSNGVKQPFFNDAVKACAMGGASGFLAGRAVWADIVGAANIAQALREVSIPRLEQLAEIVDTHAKPWTSW